MASPENVHMGNMVRTEQVVFWNLYLNVCSNFKYKQIRKINEATNLKENGRRVYGGVKRGKGREKWYNYNNITIIINPGKQVDRQE